MAASVEYKQKEISIKVDDMSLFVDFNGGDMNLEFLQNSNQLRKALGSESENSLMSAIIHGQDPVVADDLLNSENTTDYDWLLSPPRNPVPALEMEEQESLISHSLISNGHSTSPDFRLENPSADTTSTTNVVPTHPALSSNCIKSCNGTIRRPSPSRKAPSTRSSLSLVTKPLRSSTPTSRATVAATKPFAPSKRSITPTPRSSTHTAASKPTSRSLTPTPIVAASKSTLRSSTPTPIIAAVKSVSRSSTPTPIIAAVKSVSRSSTPTQRLSIIAAAKSASRSSTPTQRPSGSVNGNRPCSEMKARGSSPSVKSRPSKNPPGLPNVKLPVIETNMKAIPKRTSCSPSRGLVLNGGSVKSGITRSRGYSNVNDDDVNPVLMGTKMVERVVNMRKLAPPRQEHISNQNYSSGKSSVSQDNSGFGRSLSKNSFDMALRHLDIRRSMPGNMRAMITKVPASSVYSVRAESTKTQTITASDSPRASSNHSQ